MFVIYSLVYGGGFIRIVELMEEIVANFIQETLMLPAAENNVSNTFLSLTRNISYTAFKVSIHTYV